jgi:outer membrane receptor for ferrienterochelin and colicin
VVPIKFLPLLLIGLLSISTPLTGQWTLSGQVVDAESGEGLSYVNIVFDHQSHLNTTSDLTGFFKIEVPNDVAYDVTFVMIGYQTLMLHNISADSIPLHITMHPEIYLTDEVIVSATRKTQSIDLAPASVGLVTRHQLAERGTRTFDDAFHSINGVVATRSSNSNVQALSIRGASEVAGGGIGNRVLLLLDGRPAITPESGGALWNLVPLGAIERIEVIKGAYSSLFGSSTMGGVINVITRTPDTSAHTDLHLHYGFYQKPPAYTHFDGYHDFNGFDITHSNRIGKVSYVLNGSSKMNDGHRQSTTFNMTNIFGKVKFAFSPNRSMEVSVIQNKIHNDTPATWLSFTDPYHVATYRQDDEQQRREVNADVHYEAYAHSNLKYSSRFYYYGAFSDFIFNGDPNNDSTNVNTGKQFLDEEHVKVHRIGNATQIDININRRHYMISGFEVQADKVDGRPDTVLYGIHHAWNAGAYAQDEIVLGKKFIVTAGARYDFYNITGTFMESNISPKIAAVYHASDMLSFRTLLARAFRNPSIAERYTKFEQGGGFSFQISPLLRAEKLTLSAEVGGKINLDHKLRLDVAVYYNRYKDLISYKQVSLAGQPLRFEVVNLNNAIMQGFEASIEYDPFEKLKIFAGYNYLDARDQSTGRINDVLPYKSKHTAYLNLIYQYKIFHLSMLARSRSKIEEVFIYPGSEPDGYVVLNAKLNARLTDSFSAYLQVDNITDKQYEEIERYRLPGRNFGAGINFSF